MLKQSVSLRTCFAVILLGSSQGAIQAASKPLRQLPAPAAEMRVPLISRVASSKAHTVSRGETLWGISRKYKVDFKALAKLNGLAVEDPVLKVGQTLRLPTASKKVATAKKTVTKKPTVKKATGYGVHQVSKGETFYRIARRHGVSVSALRGANTGVDPSKLGLGQSLKIPKYGKVSAPPVEKPKAKAPEAKAPTKKGTRQQPKPGVTPPQDRAKLAPDGYGFYTVQRGDSMQTIAKRYGITREEFLRINQKSSFPNYSPRPGEFLMVPTDGSWYVPPAAQVAPTTRAKVAPPANPLRGTGRAVPTTPRKRMLVLHRVETNDSLEDLAKRFRTTTDQIRLDNPGIQKNSDLVVGLDLKIRTASPL